MDADEALQECALCFVKCLNAYCGEGGKVDNPKWFMSLFQRSVSNSFDTFAKTDKKRRERVVYVDDPLADSNVSELGEGPLFVALSGASSELKHVICVIANAPAELLNLLLKEDQDERAWSQRVSMMCRLPNVNKNVIGELRNLLQQN